MTCRSSANLVSAGQWQWISILVVLNIGNLMRIKGCFSRGVKNFLGIWAFLGVWTYFHKNWMFKSSNGTQLFFHLNPRPTFTGNLRSDELIQDTLVFLHNYYLTTTWKRCSRDEKRLNWFRTKWIFLTHYINLGLIDILWLTLSCNSIYKI